MDSGIERRRADDGQRTCAGSSSQRVEANHVVEEPDNRCRIAALGRSGSRDEVEHDSDHRLRADTPPTTPGPMPPISGHGSSERAEVKCLRRRLGALKAWSCSSGLSPFGRLELRYANTPPWPRSSPVSKNRPAPRLGLFTDPPRDQAITDTFGTPACAPGAERK